MAAVLSLASNSMAVVRVVLALAPPQHYLSDIRQRHMATGLARAVAEHNTAAIYEWIVPQLALQGISDHAAYSFARGRLPVRLNDLTRDIANPRCPRLRSWWSYAGCGYRKGRVPVPSRSINRVARSLAWIFAKAVFPLPQRG